MSWAPHAGNQTAQAPSDFFNEVLASKYVKRRPPDYSARRKRLAPEPKVVSRQRHALVLGPEVLLRVSVPVQASHPLRLQRAAGRGAGVRKVAARRPGRGARPRAARRGRSTEDEAQELVQRHLRAPYAYPALREKLEAGGPKARSPDYIRKNAADFRNLEFSEKAIEIALGDGVSVAGRIDLVRRIDTGEVTIVDLKSSDRSHRPKSSRKRSFTSTRWATRNSPAARPTTWRSTSSTTRSRSGARWTMISSTT